MITANNMTNTQTAADFVNERLQNLNAIDKVRILSSVYLVEIVHDMQHLIANHRHYRK